MAHELSPEIRLAMHQASGNEPLRFIDPDTQTAYVLVKAETFEQLQRLFGDEDPRIAYPLIEAALQADDEFDPLLAGYQSITRVHPST
ncbi:MAG: hypothetical protein JNM18_24870 [Planctomycetaceae bacterium]|nr:hypothetical protein [Planctomycetaceae bacterium]